MKIILLQLLQVSGMNDVTFTFGDLITIGGGAIATLTAFLKLQYDQRADSKATIVRFETMDKEMKGEFASLKESLIDAKTKKNSMRAELNGVIEKKDETTHKRIDAVRNDLKDYTNKTDQEFKELNAGLSEIKGMLTQILNK